MSKRNTFKTTGDDRDWCLCSASCSQYVDRHGKCEHEGEGVLKTEHENYPECLFSKDLGDEHEQYKKEHEQERWYDKCQ